MLLGMPLFVVQNTGFAQGHFQFTSNTSDSYSILVHATRLNRVSLEAGDEVGVFTSAGLCVGATVLSLEDTLQFPLTAWVDDAQTPEVDGYADGDTMYFWFWDASGNLEIEAQPDTFLVGDGTFGSGPFARIDTLFAESNRPPALNLPESVTINEDDTTQVLVLDNYVTDEDNTPPEMRWVISGTENIEVRYDSTRREARLLPTPDWNGSEDLNILVEDPSKAFAVDILPVIVLPVNDQPSLQFPDSIAFNEDDTHIVVLDGFVIDVDDSAAEMIWSFKVLNEYGNTAVIRREQPVPLAKILTRNPGQQNSAIPIKITKINELSHSNLKDSLAVTIDNAARIAIFCGTANYFTTAPILVVLTATDPGGLSGSDSIDVTITAVNDAPVVSGLPDVSFPEDSVFTLALDEYSEDVDNGDEELTWSLLVLEDALAASAKAAGIHRQITIDNITSGKSMDLHGEWNNEVEFVQDKNLRKTVIYLTDKLTQTLTDSLVITIENQIATFMGTPNFFVLNIPVRFSASDPGGLSDADTILVSVNAVNDAPVVSALPDVTFPEDNSFNLSLDSLSRDVDNSPEEMTWSAAVLDASTTGSTKSAAVNASSASDLMVSVDNQTRTAVFRGTDNYFTTTPVQVSLTATDPGGLSSSDTIDVTITAVNDAPGIFMRLLPTDGSSIVVDAVTFSWSTAIDVDGDTVIYWLNIKVSDIDTIFATTNTTLTVDFGALGLADQTYGVTWSVTASDGQVTTAAENGAGTLDVITSVEDEELAGIPEEFALHQNYPNPFNPETTIRYQLPESANVLLKIYNLQGQLVRTLVNENKEAGFHEIVWDARDKTDQSMPSGVYLYRIQAGDFTEFKKLMLLQ